MTYVPFVPKRYILERGNSIRIKHIIVRKHSNGYRIFDCRCNKHIETVFCKTAAVAIAKGLAENKNYGIDNIVSLDQDVCKTGIPISLANILTSKVFPVPGGPTNNIPLGNLTFHFLYF